MKPNALDNHTVWDVGFRYTYLPERFIEERNAAYSENALVVLPLNPTYVLSKKLILCQKLYTSRVYLPRPPRPPRQSAIQTMYFSSSKPYKPPNPASDNYHFFIR